MNDYCVTIDQLRASQSIKYVRHNRSNTCETMGPFIITVGDLFGMAVLAYVILVLILPSPTMTKKSCDVACQTEVSSISHLARSMDEDPEVKPPFHGSLFPLLNYIETNCFCHQHAIVQSIECRGYHKKIIPITTPNAFRRAYRKLRLSTEGFVYVLSCSVAFRLEGSNTSIGHAWSCWSIGDGNWYMYQSFQNNHKLKWTHVQTTEELLSWIRMLGKRWTSHTMEYMASTIHPDWNKQNANRESKVASHDTKIGLWVV